MLDARFDSSVLMTPHYKFWQCKDCNEFQKSHCFGNGKYCGHDARNNKYKGREVILEELRQKCIYQYSQSFIGTASYFWKYIRSYHSDCYGEIDEQCSRSAHIFSGLNFDTTQQCV